MDAAKWIGWEKLVPENLCIGLVFEIVILDWSTLGANFPFGEVAAFDRLKIWLAQHVKSAATVRLRPMLGS